MRTELAVTCLLVTILLPGGCATLQSKFDVKVDAIGSAGVDKKSYLLLPGNEDVVADDLQFKEYAGYVHHALKKRGFVQADSFEKANVAIFLVYGIGDPVEHQYSYPIPRWDITGPAWGQAGVSQINIAGIVNAYGNNGWSANTTINNPIYGVSGNASHAVTYATRLRYLILDAIDMKERRKTKKEVQLWKTTAASTGLSDDLSRVFPILVAALLPYIATNIDEKVEIEVLEDDEQVMEIKGIAEYNKP